MRQINSTLASVAPKQSRGLSGSYPAETASEDAAHPFSLGFRRQNIKQSWDPHLTDEEQHTGAGGRYFDSATWKPDSLGSPGMRTFDPGNQGRGFPQSNAPAPPQQPQAPQALSSPELSESPQNRSQESEYSPLTVDEGTVPAVVRASVVLASKEKNSCLDQGDWPDAGQPIFPS